VRTNASALDSFLAGGKKGKKTAPLKEEDAELAALMAELEAPKPAAAAGAKADKKKKNKKGGKGDTAAADGEEDLDALLAEFGAKPAPAPAPESTASVTTPAADAADDNDDEKDEGVSLRGGVRQHYVLRGGLCDIL